MSRTPRRLDCLREHRRRRWPSRIRARVSAMDGANHSRRHRPPSNQPFVSDSFVWWIVHPRSADEFINVRVGDGYPESAGGCA